MEMNWIGVKKRWSAMMERLKCEVFEGGVCGKFVQVLSGRADEVSERVGLVSGVV